MATLDQLERGIRAAHAAGDADAVKRLGAEYKRMKASGGAQQPQADSTTATAQDVATAAPAQQSRPSQATPKPAGKQSLADQFGVNDPNASDYMMGQGVMYAWGPEMEAGIQAGVDKMKSIVTGEEVDFSDRYGNYLTENEARDAQFREDNPGTALALEALGGAMVGGTTLGPRAASATPSSLIKQAPKIMAGGGVLGGTYGAGSADPGGRVEGAKRGARLGAATAPLPSVLTAGGKKLARGVIRPAGTKIYNKSVGLLDDADVPLTTGQRTGSKGVKAYETTMADSMLGGALDDTFGTQREALQRRLMNMAGFPDEVANTGLVSREAIDAARDNFSRRYADALDDQVVNLGDEAMEKALGAIEASHSELLTPLQRRGVKQVVDDMREKVAGEVTGKRYQQLRSQLGRLQRSNQNNPTGDLYASLKNTLDDRFVAAAGKTTAEAKKAIDRDYSHFKQLVDVYNRGGGQEVSSGVLPLASLVREASKKPGSKEWRDLTRAASTVLTDATANSGTAGRALNYLTAAGVGGSMFSPTMMAATAGGGAGLYGLNRLAARGVGSNIVKPMTQEGARRVSRGGLLSVPGTTAVAERAGLLD